MKPESLVGQLADASNDISLSIQATLRGFISRAGGPEKFGETISDIFVDEETNQTQRVAIANNVMKLMGQFGDSQDAGDLITPETTRARLRQLEAAEQEAEGDDA